ncbi:inosine triphosphate pyrophosphatase-like protein [Xylariales sp. PMI_506]|nr:inosine triphosphate pyrophosphatase-like protein [Xylariales sp. PMI_506]
MAREIRFITGNANKLADVQAILAPTGITVKSVPLDLPEMQGTIEDITTDKCRRAAELVGGPVLVDDTSLCFKAMNDLPGPYIKWFLQALGPEKLHLMLEGFPDKRAEAVATLGYCAGPGSDPVLFQGRVAGRMVAARGTTKYGWHCCFEYEPVGLTFAEMDDADKHEISHLRKALDQFTAWL